jgi:diaminopimelate decarboxylase
MSSELCPVLESAPLQAACGTSHAFREQICQTYGSPCYLYDAAEIAARAGELRSFFPAAARHRLLYSFKSNPLPSVAAEMKEAGCCPDLTSPGEILAALNAGFDLSDALYGGPGKGVEELIGAISAGVRHFSVESDRDLAHLAKAAESLEVEVKALLRINPVSAPKAKLAMTGVASQFGFEEEVIRNEGRKTLSLTGDFVAVVGIHIYWGTQIGEPEALLACFSKTVEIAEELSQMLDFPLEILNLGGGFPWPYAHEGVGPDLTPLREGLSNLQRESEIAGKAEWWFESGRYLVGSSGTLLTRVMEIKRSKEDKLFLILDTGIHHLGGMAGLGRIPRFSIDLVVPPERESNDSITVDVVGQLCTPLDCIGKKLSLPTVEVGDLLAIPNTGAYGMTASVTGFLSRPSPAEVVHRGSEILSVHRLRSGHESLT